MAGVKRPASPSTSDVAIYKKLASSSAGSSVEGAAVAEAMNNSSPKAFSTPGTSPSERPIAKPVSKVAMASKPTSITPKAPKVRSRADPLQDLFDQKPASKPTPPKFNQAWGLKPCTDPAGHAELYADQPPAHSSNAQTLPALWEDRGHRVRKGSRFVKSFVKGVDPGEDAPDLDQADLMILKLIDMRPKSSKDPTHRRLPMYYIYKGGLPLDWDNKQAIKASNDRNQQAIERFTRDKNWSRMERKFLACICREYPDASIKEMTDKLNWRFKDQDFTTATAWASTPISAGRNIESVRHEYLSSMSSYIAGKVPDKKELTDKSGEGKEAHRKFVEKFGKPDMALNHYYCDDSDNSDEGEKGSKRTKPPKTMSRVQKRAKVDVVPAVKSIRDAGRAHTDKHADNKGQYPKPAVQATRPLSASSRGEIDDHYSSEDSW